MSVFLPPRDHCVTCPDGGETEPFVPSGRGTLYAITNLYHGPIAPCGLGYVDLEEGVRVLARFDVVADPAWLTGADADVVVSYGAPDAGLGDVIVGCIVAGPVSAE